MTEPNRCATCGSLPTLEERIVTYEANNLPPKKQWVARCGCPKGTAPKDTRDEAVTRWNETHGAA